MGQNNTNTPQGAKHFVPRSYQVPAIEWIINHPRGAGLFLPMGLGKTISTLTAFDIIKFELWDANRALVVAPPFVAENTWIDEVAKWNHTKHLRIVHIGGTAKQRRQALRQDADIYTISCELIVWLAKLLGSRISYFDTLIIDELSKFKTPDAKKTAVMLAARPLFKRVIGLTGTPAPNGLINIWAQAVIVNPDLFTSEYFQFRNAFFHKPHKKAFAYEINPGAEEVIIERLKHNFMSLDAKDFPELNLKDPEFVSVEVRHTPAEAAHYKQFERDAYLAFEEGMGLALSYGEGPQIEIVAETQGALYNKLLQYTSGRIYDGEKEAHFLHDKKLDRVAEIVDELQGSPCIIFYSFQHERDAILKRIPEAEAVRKTRKGEASFNTRWNKGEIPVLVAHAASMGHGLNLQDGGHNIIWPSPTWDLELYLQANARLARQGQKEKVFIYHLITPGTLDELVMERILGKEDVQNNLIAALKRKVLTY